MLLSIASPWVGGELHGEGAVGKLDILDGLGHGNPLGGGGGMLNGEVGRVSGLVLVPDGSAKCHCSYQMRAWFALQGE